MAFKDFINKFGGNPLQKSALRELLQDDLRQPNQVIFQFFEGGRRIGEIVVTVGDQITRFPGSEQMMIVTERFQSGGADHLADLLFLLQQDDLMPPLGRCNCCLQPCWSSAYYQDFLRFPFLRFWLSFFTQFGVHSTN